MLRLMAWQYQNIGQPSRIVMVLQSRQQQVGKGVILEHVLLPIFGRASLKPATTDQIIRRFNAPIRGKAFLLLDEVLFAGDRKAADAIKNLATTTTIGMKRKACRSFNVRSPSTFGCSAITRTRRTSKSMTNATGF